MQSGPVFLSDKHLSALSGSALYCLVRTRVLTYVMMSVPRSWRQDYAIIQFKQTIFRLYITHELTLPNMNCHSLRCLGPLYEGLTSNELIMAW
jgi:hypothetical protein